MECVCVCLVEEGLLTPPLPAELLLKISDLVNWPGNSNPTEGHWWLNGPVSEAGCHVTTRVSVFVCMCIRASVGVTKPLTKSMRTKSIKMWFHKIIQACSNSKSLLNYCTIRSGEFMDCVQLYTEMSHCTVRMYELTNITVHFTFDYFISLSAVFSVCALLSFPSFLLLHAWFIQF